MQKSKHSKNKLLGLFVICAAFSAVFMVAPSKAEEVTKTALIRVNSACTISGDVSTLHRANISGGSYVSDIGTTYAEIVCNDSAGFAVYAIGFTNDTDGTTTLNGTKGGTIATGIATSGNTSNWAMKLEAFDEGTPPTILNGYNQYKAVPSDYVKVVENNSAVGAANSSIFKTTYAVYVSDTQLADTYTGQVKYVLVHPSTGPAPVKE